MEPTLGVFARKGCFVYGEFLGEGPFDLTVPPALLKHVHCVSSQSPYCPVLLCKPLRRVGQ